MAKRIPTLSIDDLTVDIWIERDRSHVALLNLKNDKLIIEWWDEEVNEAIDDGFLDPSNYLGSAAEYADSVGLIKLE